MQRGTPVRLSAGTGIVRPETALVTVLASGFLTLLVVGRFGSALALELAFPAAVAVVSSAVVMLAVPALWLVGALVLFIPLEDLLLTLAWQYLGAPRSILLMAGAVKDAVLVILVLKAALAGWARTTKFIVPDVLALFYAAFVLCVGLVSFREQGTAVGFSAFMASWRELLLPPMAYFAGRLAPLATKPVAPQLMKVFVAMAVVVAVFGLIERFVLGLSFWSGPVDMLGYMAAVKKGEWVTGTNLQPALFGWARPDGALRLKSFFQHPNNAAYYCGFAFLAVLSLRTKTGSSDGHGVLTGRWVLAVLSAAVLLTLSRSGLVLIGLGTVLIYWRNRQLAPLVAAPLLLILAVVLIPPIRASVLDTAAQLSFSGDWSRIDSIVRGVQYTIAGPFGRGVGWGTGWFWSIAGGEIPVHNTFLVIGAQIGVVGLLAFFGLVAACLSHARAMTVEGTDWELAGLRGIVWAGGVASVLLAAVSNVLLGTEPFILYWLFTGTLMTAVSQRSAGQANNVRE